MPSHGFTFRPEDARFHFSSPFIRVVTSNHWGETTATSNGPSIVLHLAIKHRETTARPPVFGTTASSTRQRSFAMKISSGGASAPGASQQQYHTATSSSLVHRRVNASGLLVRSLYCANSAAVTCPGASKPIHRH
ncbi:hypothetical protein D6C77_01025 [Aureobasidium pullulans]|nr:hypothetical protein D6C77_01025 [Aureobasidium pullulans]